jgi:hypothetical protein
MEAEAAALDEEAATEGAAPELLLSSPSSIVIDEWFADECEELAACGCASWTPLVGVTNVAPWSEPIFFF